MKRKIYMYNCMDCDFAWDSTVGDETYCPMCGCGDLHVEEDEEDDTDKDEGHD